jgi:hypothetical protein
MFYHMNKYFVTINFSFIRNYYFLPGNLSDLQFTNCARFMFHLLTVNQDGAVYNKIVTLQVIYEFTRNFSRKVIYIGMDVDGLPIIGPGVDYTQVNQFKFKLYKINISTGSITYKGYYHYRKHLTLRLNLLKNVRIYEEPHPLGCYTVWLL